MDPGYETVVDPSTLVFTMAAMGIHGVVVAVQVGLSFFLVATGLLTLRAPLANRRWMRRLGAAPPGLANGRGLAIARVGLGAALLLPLLVGASFAVSLAASLGVLALLFSTERAIPSPIRPLGQRTRRLALGAAAFVAAFTVWEGEDGLALSAEVLAVAQGWRMDELEWQLTNDVKAPKVGDLAPDFELQDPSGEVAVRLSSFRGKRPVALIFGSYT